MASGSGGSSLRGDKENWIRAVESYIKRTEATNLDLQSRDIEVEQVKAVLNFLIPRITSLSLEGIDLADGMASLVSVLTKTNVQDLNLCSCSLTNEDLSNLMKILKKTRITKLNISKNYLQLDENETKELASYLHKSQLTDLSFSNVSFLPESGALPLIQELPSTMITRLDLSKAALTHGALETLFLNLPKTVLTVLNVSENEITKDELDSLRIGLNNSKLKSLDLSNNSIDDAGIDILVEGLIRSKITDLNLNNNDFHGAVSLLNHLKETKIRILNLGKNQIEDSAMFYHPDEVWKGSFLHTLDVGGCNLSDEIMINLMRSLKHSEITKIVLRENNMQLVSILEFARLVKHTKITEADFSDNDLQHEAIQELAGCLKGSKIKTIDVSNNFKHPVGDTVLAEFISSTKGSEVQSLKMNYNELLEYGAQTLAPSLISTTFTHFDLSSNWIEDGTAALAENLKLTSIIVLDLSNNKIEDKGAEVLADCLKRTQIISLNINANSISNQGAKALAQKLKQTNLLELKLEENDIENEGLEALAKELEGTYITTLDVKNNPGDRTILVDSVLWKNRRSAQQLTDIFKRVTSKTSDGSISFVPNVPSTNVGNFLDDSIQLKVAVSKHPTAVNVLLQDKSITYSRSQITTFMADEFPREFSKFIGSNVDADVEVHVSYLRKIEKLGLKDMVELLLLNRPVYIIDQTENILHPYVYKLLKKYNLPLFNSDIEPGRREQIIKYFTKHHNMKGAYDVIQILESLP